LSTAKTRKIEEIVAVSRVKLKNSLLPKRRVVTPTMEKDGSLFGFGIDEQIVSKSFVYNSLHREYCSWLREDELVWLTVRVGLLRRVELVVLV